MMVTRRQPRNREITGPTPHSVAIMARPPNKHPPEKLILDRRKQEDKREEALAMTKYNKLFDLKNDWERWTDRRIQLNTVRRKVDGMLLANEFSVEDRRERLREQLAQEEAQYLQEMEAKEETVLERQARMRDRAKHLKEKREAERLRIVEEKYDQQFRNQCEELRSTLTKRHQDEVCAERMEQLKVKAELDNQNKEEEEMWARLWHKDMLAKAEREEREAQAQIERNKETLKTLEIQKAALAEQKAEARRLKEEEAQLLKEQAELRKLEMAKEHEEKCRRLKEARNLFDLSLKQRMKKKAKEVQEQLAFDMKILEQLLEESRNEAMEQMQRKKELREEDRRYRAYLKQMQLEEQKREMELDRLIDEEVEKMWQKRLQQWDLEKQAREKLLQDVIACRRQQLAEKRRINEQRQLESQREREELQRAIEENRQHELAQAQKVKDKFHQHQNDLIDQIEYNDKLRELERMETEREYILAQEAEREYQQKIRDCLDRPFDDKVHPMRRQRQLEMAS